MSSIRLYILGALAEEGDMHGHQLRQLAEEEHIDEWTDITVGGLYGAIKRLAAEGLIDEVRVEREGAYPERQVWTITDRGRLALNHLRFSGLSDIVFKPDPFDLAMSRLDLDRLDALPAILEARTAAIRAKLAESQARTKLIRQYLTPTEDFVMQHGTARLRAELDWHEELLRKLPDIIEDEKSRSTKGQQS